MENLIIGNKTFHSRLFVGTGKFSSAELMGKATAASGSELVTVALKRVELENPQDDMLSHLHLPGVNLLPNTSGVRNAKEAVFAAQMAREALGTNWIKLEIHPDPRYLLPDPIETLAAAEQLVKDGFIVMPYINADPVLCKRLEEVGTACVMPLGAPIGSNRGLKTRDLLRIIIEQSNVPVVVARRRSDGDGRVGRTGQHRNRRNAGPGTNGRRFQNGRRSRTHGIRGAARAANDRRIGHQPVKPVFGRH